MPSFLPERQFCQTVVNNALELDLLSWKIPIRTGEHYVHLIILSSPWLYCPRWWHLSDYRSLRTGNKNRHRFFFLDFSPPYSLIDGYYKFTSERAWFEMIIDIAAVPSPNLIGSIPKHLLELTGLMRSCKLLLVLICYSRFSQLSLIIKLIRLNCSW